MHVIADSFGHPFWFLWIVGCACLVPFALMTQSIERVPVNCEQALLVLLNIQLIIIINVTVEKTY